MIRIWHFFYKKPEGLDWETWNFSWRQKRPVVKKHHKIIFFSVQPFIVKTQFEIWKYLPSKMFLPKYLSCLLHNSVQLVPTCFILLYCRHCSQKSIKIHWELIYWWNTNDPVLHYESTVQQVMLCTMGIIFVKFIFYRSSRGVELKAIYLRRKNKVFCLYEVNSSLKYILKVKLHPNIHPNILSEIISLHENEGRGGNLAWISNWQLYIGRAA